MVNRTGIVRNIVYLFGDVSTLNSMLVMRWRKRED